MSSIKPEAVKKLLAEHKARMDAWDQAKAVARAAGEKMPPAPPRGASDFPWSTQDVEDDTALLIAERADRPGKVQVSWREYDAEGKEIARPKPLVPGVFIRNEDGTLKKDARKVAVSAARKVFAKRKRPGAPPPPAKYTPLTIREGLLRYADPSSGQAMDARVRLYTTGVRPDGRKSGMRSHALAALEAVVIKGKAVADMTYEEFSDLQMLGPEAVWRQIADTFSAQADSLEEAAAKLSGAAAADLRREAAKLRGAGSGPALKAIDRIYASASWLRQRSELPGHVGLPQTKWRQALKRDWQKRTGRVLKPHRPAYSEAEMSAIVRKLRDCSNPRLVTALALGMGLRKGQVVEDAMRSRLNLSPGVGVFGLGTLTLQGTPEKPAPTMDLTPLQRRHLDAAMAPEVVADGRVVRRAGYLSALEQAYLAGEIHDYYLLPGGKLDRGVAPVSSADCHIHTNTLSQMFAELEAAAGVEKKPGRGWHGLRRGMKEAIERVTDDEAVRDEAGGWAVGGGTRHLYADEEEQRRIGEAAKARAQVWAALGTDALASALAGEAAALREMVRRLQPFASESTAIAEAVQLATRLQDVLESAAGEAAAAEGAEEAFGLPNAAEREHESLAVAILDGIRARGWSGKVAAGKLAVSPSYITCLRQGRSSNVISTARLRAMLELLESHPVS